MLHRLKFAVARAPQRDAHVFAAVFFLPVREGGAHRQRHQSLRPRAGQPPQQRLDHPNKRHEHRHRIARQPDESRAVASTSNDAHCNRPARLDGDAPEHQAADALDRAAHMIGFAGGDAARGDHQVVAGGGRLQRPRQRIRVVAQNTEIGHLRAEPIQ